MGFGGISPHPGYGLYELIKESGEAQKNDYRSMFKARSSVSDLQPAKRRECEGCGAPLGTYVKCEYCGRLS